METGNLFRAFDTSAAGLSAQRARLNAISANIANVQTTRTPEGGPYRRQVVQLSVAGEAGSDLFARLLAAKQGMNLAPERTSPRHLPAPGPVELERARVGVDFSVAVDNTTPTRLEYDPGHPDANEDGYVEYPNVEIIREMVDLMAAARAYEANVTVLNSTKAMLRKALEI